MEWYKCLEDIEYAGNEYIKGEEYTALPDDLLEDYGDSFELVEEEQSEGDDNPFN